MKYKPDCRWKDHLFGSYQFLLWKFGGNQAGSYQLHFRVAVQFQDSWCRTLLCCCTDEGHRISILCQNGSPFQAGAGCERLHVGDINIHLSYMSPVDIPFVTPRIGAVDQLPFIDAYLHMLANKNARPEPFILYAPCAPIVYS